MANLNDLPETPQNPYVDPNEPQGGGAVPPAGPADREPNRDARMWAMFAHLAGLAFLLPVVPGIGAIIGPLIVWLIKKDQYPFVDEQGKEALNFQITMLIYGAVATLLTVSVVLACVGIPVLVAVAIADIVLLIIAAIKTNDGLHYRYPYPLIIRFIK